MKCILIISILISFISFTGSSQKILIKYSAGDCISCSLIIMNQLRQLNNPATIVCHEGQPMDESLTLLKNSLGDKVAIIFSEKVFYKFDSLEATRIFLLDEADNVLGASSVKLWKDSLSVRIGNLPMRDHRQIYYTSREGTSAAILDPNTYSYYKISTTFPYAQYKRHYDPKNIYENVYKNYFDAKAGSLLFRMNDYLKQTNSTKVGEVRKVWQDGTNTLVHYNIHWLDSTGQRNGEMMVAQRALVLVVNYKNGTVQNFWRLKQEDKLVQSQNLYEAGELLFYNNNFYGKLYSDFVNPSSVSLAKCKKESDEIVMDRIVQYRPDEGIFNSQMGYSMIDMRNDGPYFYDRSSSTILNVDDETEILLPVTNQNEVSPSEAFAGNILVDHGIRSVLGEGNYVKVLMEDNLQLKLLSYKKVGKSYRLMNTTIIKQKENALAYPFHCVLVKDGIVDFDVKTGEVYLRRFL